MQRNILKQGEQLRFDVDAMKKRLFCDYQERCRDRFSRNSPMSVARRAGAQVKPDDADVLGDARRTWEARRVARLRRRREAVQDVDAEDKENACSSKRFSDCDEGRRKRGRDVLPSCVQFNSSTGRSICSDPARLSSQFDRFFASLPPTDGPSRRPSGRCRCCGRSTS